MYMVPPSPKKTTPELLRNYNHPKFCHLPAFEVGINQRWFSYIQQTPALICSPCEIATMSFEIQEIKISQISEISEISIISNFPTKLPLCFRKSCILGLQILLISAILELEILEHMEISKV